MLRYLAVLIAFLSPRLALAVDAGIPDAGTSTVAPVVDPNAVVDIGFVIRLIEALTSAFGDHAWTLVVGLFLTMIVAGLRFFELVKKVPKVWVPWVTVGLAVLGSVAVGMQQGLPWGTVLTGGITVGVVAIGGWETIGKMLVNYLKKLFAKKPPESKPEAEKPEAEDEKSKVEDAPPSDPPG